MREALMRLPAAAEQTRAQRKRDKAWWTLAGPDEGISEGAHPRESRRSKSDALFV
jgi:hypothetical protein